MSLPIVQDLSSNRVLHLTSMAEKHLANVRIWAEQNGYTTKLNNALEYVRTFSGGPEEHWLSELHVDTPFNPNEKNFIAAIYKRKPDGNLIQYMVIGMIWSDYEKNWNFHS